MRLQEQGKTQQVSYISLHVEHLALICQQRAEAAKKNEKKKWVNLNIVCSVHSLVISRSLKVEIDNKFCFN